MSGLWRNVFLYTPMFLVVFLGGLCSATSWPGGNYGLPMPVTGCPKSNFIWETGWRFQDTEDKNPRNFRSPVFHVEGSVRESSVNRSFCMKTSASAGSGSSLVWPKGEFCIYKGSTYCPQGLQEGQVTWDDEDEDNQNKKGGSLPEGSYEGSVSASTRIEFCCSTSGSKTIPISLPVDTPFYLLAYDSKQCQQVKWAVATSEWIHYDTEAKNNIDEKYGSFPYRAMGGVDGHTIYYCYYTSCKYVLNNTSGVLQSPFFPVNYPNGQLCSWSISVHSNQTIHLSFTHFSLNTSKQGDILEIYDGNDDNARMIGSYQGDRIPDAVRSSSNHLFVVFQSDSAWNDKGFRAEYQAINNQEPSTATTAVMSAGPALDSTTIFSTKKLMSRKACLQKSVTEVPVASVVVPIIVCLAAAIVVAMVIVWRWRELHSCEKKPSIRYQDGAVNNPAYVGAVLQNTSNSDSDRSVIMPNDEDKEEIYQEVNEQQMDNPLYESTDQSPILVSGNILYDSISSKSPEEDFTAFAINIK